MLDALVWLFKGPDMDEEYASRRFAQLSRRCDSIFEPRTKEHDEWMCKELKREIRSKALQGGKEKFKRAVAMWQMYHALYPEHITNEEYPKLTKKIWHHPPSNPPDLL